MLVCCVYAGQEPVSALEHRAPWRTEMQRRSSLQGDERQSNRQHSALLMAAQHVRARRNYIVIFVGIVGVVLLISLFPSSTRSRPASLRSTANRQALPVGSSTNAQLSPAQSNSSNTVPTRQCGNDPVIYPEWPTNFSPNVSAVFVIGAPARMLEFSRT